MWPDLWIALAALVAAVAVVPIGRWLVRAARRLEEQAPPAATAPPSPARAAVVATTEASLRTGPPPHVHVPPKDVPPERAKRRGITRRTAREGVVLAAILGPCRGLRMEEHDS